MYHDGCSTHSIQWTFSPNRFIYLWGSVMIFMLLQSKVKYVVQRTVDWFCFWLLIDFLGWMKWFLLQRQIVSKNENLICQKKEWWAKFILWIVLELEHKMETSFLLPRSNQMTQTYQYNQSNNLTNTTSRPTCIACQTTSINFVPSADPFAIP